jgi:GNAT superfamily N-acetyltransferase
VHYTPTDPAHPDAVALVAALDAELHERYPGAPVHGIDPSTLVAQGGVFLVGRLDGRPVACGALRPLPDGSVEVKRMYVDPAARRRGAARALLAALEEIARTRGFALVRIETGDHQPEAVALYERAGYAPIPPFGEYVGNSFSVCFEKRLEVGG